MGQGRTLPTGQRVAEEKKPSGGGVFDQSAQPGLGMLSRMKKATESVLPSRQVGRGFMEGIKKRALAKVMKTE